MPVIDNVDVSTPDSAPIKKMTLHDVVTQESNI